MYFILFIRLKCTLPQIFLFAKTNLLVISNTSAKKIFDSDKSSIFCAPTIFFFFFAWKALLGEFKKRVFIHIKRRVHESLAVTFLFEISKTFG